MITDLTSKDEGMYTCVARNILGEVTSSATSLQGDQPRSQGRFPGFTPSQGNGPGNEVAR